MYFIRTLLVSINEATKLPDGTRCPAFALVVRDKGKDLKDIEKERGKEKENESRSDGDENQEGGVSVGAAGTQKESKCKKTGARSKGLRECLLVIRGTASSMDWSINMDDLSVPLSYRAGPVDIPSEVLYCVVCCAVLCCAVLCCSVLWCAVVCCGVLWCGVLCCAVLWCGVVWCAALCYVLWCGVLWCAVVCCGVVCCGVVCCGVLWCAVLWCAVVCCPVL